MEGITQLQTGNLTSVSAQELVDCDSENEGCILACTATFMKPFILSFKVTG